MGKRRRKNKAPDDLTRGIMEWVGGSLKMPGYVMGEGEPYRPEILLWLGDDGAILGMTVEKPGDLLRAAGESLRSTMEHPMEGAPRRPARLRVESTQLADALRVEHPDLQIVCAPTPELEPVAASLQESMELDADSEQSYLAPDLSPSALASMFRAAAALYRGQPWKIVPADEALISVTSEELGVRDAVLSVIGQMGESFGFLLFDSLEDYDAYIEAASRLGFGDVEGEKPERDFSFENAPEMPAHLVLNYERGAELAPSLRREVAKYGWEVADPSAYPEIVVIDGDLVARAPTPREIRLVAAIASGLLSLLQDPAPLQTAWAEGDAYAKDFSVATHDGEIGITLGTVAHPDYLTFAAPGDLLYALADLELDPDDQQALEMRELLERELLQRFENAPEARELEGVHHCHVILQLGATYLGQTAATLQDADLYEILFELVPRKVSIDASGARSIIEELRAFYRFLRREFALPQADACLRRLDDGAIAQLEDALGDSANFGVAKSLFMASAREGFDMQSQEGIDAWMASMQGRRLPDDIPLPGDPPKPPGGKAEKARKAKRKSARKARKKHR